MNATCPECGKPVGPNALQGLCPECMMKIGLGSEVQPGTAAAHAKGKSFVPPTPAELAPIFPQLEILELIGQGGMGAVYKARQKELDRIVALKVLPPDIGGDAAFAERFTREAKALARLNHPGIVTIHEFGRADGLYFFVMEFVDGVNLRQLLGSGRVSPREALAIVPQICDALQFAHDHQIVHRDIKPENILLDRQGRVKVADFGLAKIVGTGADTEPGVAGAAAPIDLTGAGKVVGTPAYMAPEQIKSPAEVDHRADIYALGVVLYQMLTGELPGKRIELPSKKVQIDVRLDEVVLRALESKPELRYQQVNEVKTIVETIASEPNMKTNKSNWRMGATAAAMVVCLIIAGGIAILRQRPQSIRGFQPDRSFLSGRSEQWSWTNDAAADGADVRLQSKVKYAAKQASVQDIVQNLAQQAGLKYDWQKSFAQTDPVCRQWVRDVTIDGKTCRQALEQILKPVGLRYQVEDGVLVLSPQPSGTAPGAGGGNEQNQADVGPADPRQEKKVRYSTEQASVQDIVQNLAQQAGLKYDWQKSFAQTDPLCRQWVRDVTIDGKTCRQALEQILKPVGLRYQVEDGVLVLSRQDEGTHAPKSGASSISPPMGKGYVTTESAPTGLTPARILSAKEQRENFDFLCKAIDETYADFELKAIDWEGVCRRYQERLDPAASTDEFYRLLFQLVNELKDTHSWLENYHVDFPASGPELTVALFEGKPFIVAVNADSEAAGLGVKPGSKVLEVDGLPVEDEIERLRLQLRACSSERAFRREATRYLLAGERDTKVKVKLRLPDGHAQSFVLRRTGGVSDPPRQPCAFDLKQGRFVQFGRHPSGLGYIRIMSFNSHNDVAPEFDQALEALRTAPGLILDIRDNSGGFSQPQIVGRLLQRPALCEISFVKNGPRHGDLMRHEVTLEPTGGWQYGNPIALLINDRTGSAADLFACELRSAKRVVTVGSTTHGNLSGVAAYAVLPCGLIVRISNGYVCDATGKPIEGVGNEPDVPVSPSIDDMQAGRDPAVERAAALMGERLHRMGVN